jgi:putative transposase
MSCTPDSVVRTLRVRLKDKHAAFLQAQAREVNLVWNFCAETSLKILRRERRFCSNVDLDRLTAGVTKEGLSLHSQTVQAISAEYVTRRRQCGKAKLAWRVSDRKRARYSLGWIPFKASAVRYKGGQIWYCGRALSLWDSWGLANYVLGPGSFSEDARGRWYFNVTVEAAAASKVRVPLASAALGIDLGLKSLMCDSNGAEVEARHFYRDIEDRIAVAQRAGKKARVRALHAKAAHRRRDHLHKLSSGQAREHCAIFVGNVDASALAQTGMAKSVLDSGWSTYRTMLRYKCDGAGVWFKEIDERYSTQECHVCHERTGPAGRDALGVRHWTCASCASAHHRDHNAAINIRERGLQWLEQQFSTPDAGQMYAPGLVVNEAFELSGSKAAAGRGRLAGGILGLQAG